MSAASHYRKRKGVISKWFPQVKLYIWFFIIYFMVFGLINYSNLFIKAGLFFASLNLVGLCLEWKERNRKDKK